MNNFNVEKAKLAQLRQVLREDRMAREDAIALHYAAVASMAVDLAKMCTARRVAGSNTFGKDLIEAIVEKIRQHSNEHLGGFVLDLIDRVEELEEENEELRAALDSYKDPPEFETIIR